MPAHLATPVLIAAACGGLLVLGLVGWAVHTVREYERLLVFRLGRLTGARGPGLVVTVPVVDRVRRISLRVDTIEIPPVALLTADDAELRVTAAVLYRIVDPIRAVVSIRDYEQALVRIAQATMRATLGRYERAALLAGRTTINRMLTEVVDAATEDWGLKVERLQIEDLEVVGDVPPAPTVDERKNEQRTVKRETVKSPVEVSTQPAESKQVRAPAESKQLPAWM